MAKLVAATKAIKQAKKNAIARKKQMAAEVRAICADKINMMVSEGVVSNLVPLNEEQYIWGYVPTVKQELEAAGYKVIETEDEETGVPDIEISIEHLK